MKTALYLYGITEVRTVARVDATGIDGAAEVKDLPCAGFTCWVSRVSQEEFAEPLAKRMEDLDWLARAGVRHQQVVAELARSGSILPARFGSIFLSEESLAEDVRRRKTDLLECFRKVEDADEWGVKVFRVAQAPNARPAAASGTEYLQRKSEEAQRRGAHPTASEVKELAAALAKVARDSAQGGSITQGQKTLEWHGAFLVPRKQKTDFERKLHEFAREHESSFSVEVTGPWPPYSFVKHG